MQSNAAYSRSDSMKAVEAILAAILQWRAAWLKEQALHSSPPPICRQVSKKLKIAYDSYKDYESTHVPLLMHEIWSQVFEESTSAGVCEPPPTVVLPQAKHSPTTPAKEFQIGVVDYAMRQQFYLNLRCQCLVENDRLHTHMKLCGDGDMVLLELAIDPNQPDHAGEIVTNQTTGVRTLTLFGYVTEIYQERIGPHTQLAECFARRLGQVRGQQAVNYVINIAQRPMRLKLDELMKLRSIYYLRPMLRQIESIICLRDSRLCEDILRPRLVTCSLPLPTVINLSSSSYNESQYKAIVGVFESIIRPHPKIQLIQGPPGTGKTHTLVGIIKHIYSHWPDKDHYPKILVCAPSNGAIDEVAKRLIVERTFLRQSVAKRSLRLVRVGNQDQIHESVASISLDKLVDTNVTVKSGDVKKRSNNCIHELEKQLMECDVEISNLRVLGRHAEIPHVESKIAMIVKDIDSKRQQADLVAKREISDASKRNIRYDLIRNADVILTTLNSCQRHPLDALFKSERSDLHFQCVIVDEASQCCEPELLMPLAYRISKMVLIGDPMQLPATVISRHSQEFGFSRSLFERFFIHFGRYDPSSPVMMLNEQYRMHPDICHFPSKQFYDSRLLSKSTASRLSYPIKPYLVLDLVHSKESSSSNKSVMNEVEAEFVRNLLTTILMTIPANSRVGVITPYQGQRRLITSKILSMTQEKNITIDVNTCDGFQGQERDVIILSCVRAFDQGSTNGQLGFMRSAQRMNVALTRAKHALYVVISARSLSKDSNWSAMIDDAKERECLQSFTQNLPPTRLLKIVCKS